MWLTFKFCLFIKINDSVNFVVKIDKENFLFLTSQEILFVTKIITCSKNDIFKILPVIFDGSCMAFLARYNEWLFVNTCLICNIN